MRRLVDQRDTRPSEHPAKQPCRAQTCRGAPSDLSLVAAVQQLKLGVCRWPPAPHPIIRLHSSLSMLHSCLWQQGSCKGLWAVPSQLLCELSELPHCIMNEAVSINSRHTYNTVKGLGKRLSNVASTWKLFTVCLIPSRNGTFGGRCHKHMLQHVFRFGCFTLRAHEQWSCMASEEGVDNSRS